MGMPFKGVPIFFVPLIFINISSVFFVVPNKKTIFVVPFSG